MPILLIIAAALVKFIKVNEKDLITCFVQINVGVCGRPRTSSRVQLQGSRYLHGDEVTFSCPEITICLGKPNCVVLTENGIPRYRNVKVRFSCENEIISMSRAWDKEIKNLSSRRIRTYDLPNTGQRSIYLSYGELKESEAIYLVHI